MNGFHIVPWLSFGVAALVALISFLQFLTARHQWRIANNRFAFDLFQRRYEVYKDFREVVGSIAGSGRVESETFVKAAEAAERSKFLFGGDINAYLDEFTRDLLDLQSYSGELEGLQVADRQRNLSEQRRLKNRIEEFRTRGPALFATYIRFDHKII